MGFIIGQTVFSVSYIGKINKYTLSKISMKIDITLRQLRAFIAVLDCGSFSDAAESMHLSQAALSGLIKELEGRLGVRLLDRSTRHVSVSVVGAAFEPLVRSVLANLDEAVESVLNLREVKRGVVRVAAPETLSCTLMPQLIAAYAQRYPGIDVRFADVPIEEVIAQLESGHADVGFGPAVVPLDSAFHIQTLLVDPLWVALQPTDPLAKQDQVSWQELQQHTLINYMPNLMNNVLSNIPTRLHPHDIMNVHRVNTALSMLRIKPAFVLCPSMAKSLVEGFGLVFLPIQQPTVTWQVAMFTRNRELLSPAVQSFMDFALGLSRSLKGKDLFTDLRLLDISENPNNI